MQAHERREIGRAIRAYDGGRDDEGRAILARLAGNDAPEKPGRRAPIAGTIGEAAPVEPPTDRIVTPIEAALRAERGAAPVTALPKPRRRIKDATAIADYVRTHPDCEVLACRHPPCPEPHHLIGRKSYRKGDDTPGNLIRLCEPHHALYHSSGPRLWLATFRRHLTADTLSKVERAAIQVAAA